MPTETSACHRFTDEEEIDEFEEKLMEIVKEDHDAIVVEAETRYLLMKQKVVTPEFAPIVEKKWLRRNIFSLNRKCQWTSLHCCDWWSCIYCVTMFCRSLQSSSL